MQRQRVTDTGELVHLLGIGEFLLNRQRRRRLQILPESCAGIGKAPARELDPERVEAVSDALGGLCLHHAAPCRRVGQVGPNLPYPPDLPCSPDSVSGMLAAVCSTIRYDASTTARAGSQQ